MIPLKHFGKVVNGKMVFYNDSLHKEAVKSLEGKEFELTLKEKSKRVTTDQHAYYRKGVLGTALEFEIFGGWDKDELHLMFADMFLTEVVMKESASSHTGLIEIRKTRSTASLNRKEMAQFIDNCIKWLATQGIVVLDSEHYILQQYKS